MIDIAPLTGQGRVSALLVFATVSSMTFQTIWNRQVRCTPSYLRLGRRAKMDAGSWIALALLGLIVAYALYREKRDER